MRLFWTLVLALVATTASARACTDDSAMRYYFFDHEPVSSAGRSVLLVRIVEIDGDIVRARVDARFAKALGIDLVTIDLPRYPWGSNCISYGLTDGLAFVAVDRLSGQKARTGRAVAVALREPYDTRPRRGKAELDGYIVDPAVKATAGASEVRVP